MDFRQEATRDHIIVFAHSARWCSAIRRNFSHAKLSWVLDIDGLLEEAFEGQSTAAIVEYPFSNLDEIGVPLNQLSNNSLNLKLFAVGDDGLVGWRPFLRAVGFAGCYWSLLQIPELVQVVKTHSQSLPPRNQSIEQSVMTNLPWPTAATKDQA